MTTKKGQVTMHVALKVLLVFIVVVVILVGIGWVGFQISAPAFDWAHEPSTASQLEHVPLRDDLPPPVERFALVLFPDGQIPVVESAMVQGQTKIAPTGFFLPGRYRFYYDAQDRGYFRTIDITWFTLRILSIRERFMHGEAMLDLGPIGRVDNQPKTNQAATQGYWTEVLAEMPAIALGNPDLVWEALDDHSALLHVPGLDRSAAITVRFDPDSDLMRSIETLRYRSEDDAEPTFWLNTVNEWAEVDGWTVVVDGYTQWENDPAWAYWYIKHVTVNLDVSQRFANFEDEQ